MSLKGVLSEEEKEFFKKIDEDLRKAKEREEEWKPRRKKWLEDYEKSCAHRKQVEEQLCIPPCLHFKFTGIRDKLNYESSEEIILDELRSLEYSELTLFEEYHSQVLPGTYRLYLKLKPKI